MLEAYYPNRLSPSLYGLGYFDKDLDDDLYCSYFVLAVLIGLEQGVWRSGSKYKNELLTRRGSGLWGIDHSPGPRSFMSLKGINRMDRREDTHIGLQRLVYSFFLSSRLYLLLSAWASHQLRTWGTYSIIHCLPDFSESYQAR